MDNVDFIVGASTEAIAAEGFDLATAGGIDTPRYIIFLLNLPEFGLDNGITTLFGVVLVRWR